MAVTYVKPYPSGWRDLPDTSTPIYAANMDAIDQGIIDAQAQATAAQNTADTALAAGGDGIFAIPGLALDGVTDDGPAIQAALEAVEDGTRGASLLVHGNAGQVCYINSTVTISRSGTKLLSDVEFLFGQFARIRPWGVIDEQPVLASAKPELTADAASGAHTVHVNAIPTDWGVGDYLGLRGNRSSSGAVLSNQIYHGYVTALDRTALTITFDEGLNAAYKALNTTTWSNKKSQLTKVTQMTLTGSPDAGDVTVTGIDSSVFTVGDIVQVADDTHTLDGDGSVQDGNFAHKECAKITEIPNGTSVKLSHALYHSYDTSQNARIQKLDALEDVELRDWTIRFAAQMDDGEHAIEVRYAHNTHLRNIHIIGGNDGGFSWDGHAIRFTDSLNCSAQTGAISDPSDVTAGRGYGVSFYGSTLCWVQDFSISGCRHSVLWFNGASGCEAHNVRSTDARISDFDWHGADCVNNRTVGCTAVGGTRSTADSTYRTAWKWGNPSHRPGDRGNYATGCMVVNYAGVAVEGIPTSGDDVWQGVVQGASVGVKLRPLADDGTQIVDGFVVRDSEFYDVTTPFDIDGGSSAIVTKLVIDNNRWHRCGNFELANAPGVRFTRNQVIDPTGTGYILSVDNCDGAMVKGNDFSGADRGIEFTNSAAFRCTGNDMHDLTGSTVVFRDGGGNTGYWFTDNRAVGFTPSASYAGTPSAGTLELVPASGGGGGGGGTYPPSGGVPYSDLNSAVQALLSGAYQLPGTGIPKTDLASAVQTSLGKADSAYQRPSGGIPNSDLATPGGGSGGYAADTPAGHGYDEWAYDVSIPQSSSAATAGRLELVRVRVTSSGTSTGLVFSVATAASGLTAAYGIVYDAAGNQIAVTGDISSSFTSTGVKSVATTANYARTQGQDLYLATLQVGGTPAALHRAVTSAGLGNAGLNAAAGYRFMSFGSGLTSAPSTITVSSGVSSSNTYWMAIR